jgi:hypothetical protein
MLGADVVLLFQVGYLKNQKCNFSTCVNFVQLCILLWNKPEKIVFVLSVLVPLCQTELSIFHLL